MCFLIFWEIVKSYFWVDQNSWIMIFFNSDSSGSCLQKRIDEYCQGTVKDACPNFGYARYNTDKVKIEVQK